MASEGGDVRRSVNKHKTTIITAGAFVAALIVWRLHSASKAATAAAATQGITDGQTTPAPTPTASSSMTPTSLQAWIQDALSNNNTTATYTSAALLNDITSWLGGQCVTSAGYNVIANLVETQGVPPGYAAPPALTVCPNSTPTPSPSTPAGLSAQQLESVLDQQVGELGRLSGVGATPQQLAQWQNEAAAKGLSGLDATYYEQTQNIGVAAGSLKRPSLASIQALAVQLAGGQAAYAALPSIQQQQLGEIANVTLIEKLNPAKATAAH